MTSQDIQTQTASPPTSLKERQRQERAELILQAAEAVLAEKGYHDTSMDEIAARVGIAKGTVYLHYPSKDDLAVALFAREMKAFQQAIEQIAAGQGSARERLEAMLRHGYAGVASQRRQMLLSLYTSMGLRKSVFEQKLSLSERMEQVATTIKTVLEEGKASGELDSGIPTAVMLTTFLGLLSPQGYDRMLKLEPLSLDEIVTYVSHIFFHGTTTHTSSER